MPQKIKKLSIFFIFSRVREASGEAALAADLITAWKPVRGGCASSRLIHGRTGGASKVTAAGQDITLLFWIDTVIAVLPEILSFGPTIATFPSCDQVGC